MRHARLIFFAFGLIWLAGCAPSRTPEQQAFLESLGDRPITCKGKADCDEKWQRATKWVVDHNHTGIKKITDTAILTFMDHDTTHSYNLTEFEIIRYREGDHYVIHYKSDCDSGVFSCKPSGLALRIDFINTLMGLPPGVTEIRPGVYQKTIHE